MRHLVLIVGFVLFATPAYAFDYIGPDSSLTNGNRVFRSMLDTDTGSLDVAVQAWVSNEAGEEQCVTVVVGGSGGFDPANVQEWHFAVWSDLTALTSSPGTGDLFDAVLSPASIVPFGTDANGSTTFRVEFEDVNPSSEILPPGLHYIGVYMVNSSVNNGIGGVLESGFPALSGVQVGDNVPGGVQSIVDSPFSMHDGTLAYKVRFLHDNDIPTLNEWGLMILTLLLLGSGVIAVRRPPTR